MSHVGREGGREVYDHALYGHLKLCVEIIILITCTNNFIVPIIITKSP